MGNPPELALNPPSEIEAPRTLRYWLVHGNVLRFGMSFVLWTVSLVGLTYLFWDGHLSSSLHHSLTETFRHGIVYCFLALGACLVIATSEIDLSSLGVATLSGVVFALIASWLGQKSVFWPAVASGLACVVVCTASGLLVSFCVNRFHAPPLIFTWALGNLYILIAIMVTSLASSKVVSSVATVGLPKRWMVNALSWEFGGVAFNVCCALILGCIVFFYGLNMPMRAAAVGGNADSARYAGILKGPVLRNCFVANALLAGCAGIIHALIFSAAATKDLEISINGLVPIAIALIGGTSLAGGYVALWSVVSASLFWSTVSLLGPLFPRYVEWFKPIEAELGQGLFFFAFLAVALVFGYGLAPPASKIYAPRNS